MKKFNKWIRVKMTGIRNNKCKCYMSNLCPKCNKESLIQTNYCPNCGKRLRREL